MDPITAAILAVLPALASDVVKAGVKDAYDGPKAVIRRKWGENATDQQGDHGDRGRPEVQGAGGRA